MLAKILIVANVLAPLSVLGNAEQPMACTNIQSEMGPFFRWPTANPGMVAPVMLVWNYPTYRSPLQSSFTGKSIQIDIPASFGQTAGFHLGATAVPTKTDPRFRLTRIDIRKPATAYPGLGQALSHVMEMVLIHREENGVNWANVILPFQVSTNGGEMDIINPIIGNTKLPNRISQTGYLMASAASELKLSPAYENATFSEFWNSAPVAGCDQKSVNVRYFMRRNTMALGIDTFAELSQALENVPQQEPVAPPDTTWLMDTCRNNTGTCKIRPAINQATKLANMQKFQSQALTNQRAKKAALDTDLAALKNHTGPATKASIALYDKAVLAYTALKAAAAELVSSEDSVAKLKVFADQEARSTWDQLAPKAGPAAAAPAAAAPAAAAPAAAAPKAPSSLLAEGEAATQMVQSNNCRALGQSPVNIDTSRVVDAAAAAPALIQPLAFRYMSLADGGHSQARLHISNHGQHLRVAVPPGSVEWPLGGMLSAGVLRGVSYVDIHVPGEHAVDGHLPAAELQLVHESVGGKPAMAVAVPLELGDGSNDNQWLKPLLLAMPQKNAAREVFGNPMGLLQSDLYTGATSKYLRYDGSLTKPPCLRTQWFVLEQAGRISQQQLSELGVALGSGANSQQAMPLNMASLVTRGSPQLIQVAGASENVDPRPIRLRVKRLQI